ncbi:exonuclease [candidate division GN15 bacterium]|nr:exonuclease [candidate division GN15 bacterium]
MNPNTSERLVIIDLEATCWEPGRHKPSEMETIEIGAVLVDHATGNKLDEFNTFIRPVRYPILSDFCKKLTSISQGQIDSAPRFPEAFQRFLDWIYDRGNVILASWGAYDDKQLKQDCSFHGIDYPFHGRHLNLKKEFGKLHNGRKFGMKRALQLSGLTLEGQHHRGIDDARNIYRLYLWLRQHSQ